MNENIFASQLDRQIYRVGREAHIWRTIRAWQDRPTLRKGDHVVILAFKHVADYQHFIPKVLVRTDDGRERWIHAADLELDDDPSPSAYVAGPRA